MPYSSRDRLLRATHRWGWGLQPWDDCGVDGQSGCLWRWLLPKSLLKAGLVSQVLYLEAEEAGIRSTGIGCYFDDPVHEVFGLHLAIGIFTFHCGWPSRGRTP